MSIGFPPTRSADQASALAHFGSETDVARHFDRMRCPYEGDAITREVREAAMAIRPRTDDGLAPPPLSLSLRPSAFPTKIVYANAKQSPNERAS